MMWVKPFFLGGRILYITCSSNLMKANFHMQIIPDKMFGLIGDKIMVLVSLTNSIRRVSPKLINSISAELLLMS